MFATDERTQQQWHAFIADVAVNPGSLEVVVADLADFLMPHGLTAAGMRPGLPAGRTST
ncbi:MAG: hypothetical protein HOO99_02510 [Hyphomicrobiaceae bacterium]|nr:hypothetical protein [Hyphomicrobiaceae bacterium]